MTVGTTAVALTPAGLVLAGTTVPVSSSPLQPVLAAAGLSVRPVAAETTTDGVVSAGLVVTRTQALPTAMSPVTVTYTFGRASAAVSATPLPRPAPVDAVAPVPAPSSPAGGPGDSGATAPDADAGAALGADAAAGAGEASSPATALAGPVGGAGGLARVGGIAGAGGVAGPAAGAAEEAAPPAPSVAAVPVRKVASRLFDLSTIYLLLVAAAAMAGGVIQLVRGAGVRRPWTSKPG